MLEKARQGVFPGLAPFGYRNDKTTRTIEVDPVDSPMVVRLMEAYATGADTLSTLRKMLKTEFGKTMSKGGIDRVLKNPFYIGEFNWGGEPTSAVVLYSLTGRRSRPCSRYSQVTTGRSMVPRRSPFVVW